MNRAITTCITFAMLALLPIHPGSSHQTQSPTHVKGHALLVGINNYKNFPHKPTPGSEEDAIATKEFIKRQYGFQEDEIHSLLGPEATAKKIVAEFRSWLIAQTQPGERVFFLYSGHGTQVKDDNGDEEDGMDEAIAPYDVDMFGNNLIRDDVFDQLIGELSGRMVVMVFDSCHSGTISRGTGEAGNDKAGLGANPKYLPSPEQFAELAKAARTRSIGGAAVLDYTVGAAQEGKTKSRDLHLSVDIPQIKNTGVVIFSAAQANQRAFPVEIGPGRFRGALSYVFNEAQRDGAPILSELKKRIETQIAALQRAGRLPKEQQPLCEVISGGNTISLEDQPLFGAAQMAQVLAEGNPGSKLVVKLRVQPNARSFRLNQEFNYEVETSEEGYLYLLVFSEENKATCLLPNPNLTGIQNNHIERGTHRVPPDKGDNYEAKPPLGKDIVIAILSKSKLNLGEKEDYTWDEVFERLRNKQFFEYAKTRGQGATGAKPLGQTDWQAVSLVMETTR